MLLMLVKRMVTIASCHSNFIDIITFKRNSLEAVSLEVFLGIILKLLSERNEVKGI